MATSAPRTRRFRRRREEPMEPGDDKKPRNFTQWLLLYPTLGVALLTAGPQWYDRIGAIVQKTGTASLSESRAQNALWKKNISCLGAPSAWFQSTTKVKIDATICDSGDIFVQALTPDNTPHMTWISLDEVVKQAGPGGSAIIPSANAATPPAANSLFHQAQFVVLCQKFIDDRHVLRRVKTAEGCFDEVIDTFNGSVVKRSPAPCEPNCG
jgi:hypothetical protein